MATETIGYDELAKLTGIPSRDRAITYAVYLLIGLAEQRDGETAVSLPWRTEQALHCIGDQLEAGGWDYYGVEVINKDQTDDGEAYWYLNRGDPWEATVIVREADGNSFIGCWGDLVYDAE